MLINPLATAGLFVCLPGCHSAAFTVYSMDSLNSHSKLGLVLLIVVDFDVMCFCTKTGKLMRYHFCILVVKKYMNVPKINNDCMLKKTYLYLE